MIESIINKLNLDPESKRKLNQAKNKPIKIIGIGQCGVGKTTLLKSIFSIKKENTFSNKEEEISFNEKEKIIIDNLQTGGVKAVTKDFFSFTIESKDGFKIQFTDGPGLGESFELDEVYKKHWVNKILESKQDILYWVIDGSSRDISHIEKNMIEILSKTGYKDKTVVVLNKVDQILLSEQDVEQGLIGWDTDYNIPSEKLEELIEERTNDLIEKLLTKVGLKKKQIVVCSARFRWNHGKVLDALLDILPKHKKIFVSKSRDVKDFRDLMSEKTKQELGVK